MRIHGLRLLAVCLLTVGLATAQEPKPAALPTGDGRAPFGEYVEIDVEGRANRDFLLLVQEVSPNIVILRGKNGWLAFATFDAEKKEYRGSFEWPNIPGLGRPEGKWGELYQIKVMMKDNMLRIEGKSAKNEFLIRARSSAELATPKTPTN